MGPEPGNGLVMIQDFLRLGYGGADEENYKTHPTVPNGWDSRLRGNDG